MEITDKDRLDFMEENYIEVYRIDSDTWEACDGFGKSGEANTIRKAIDNAIIAIREKNNE